MRRAVLVLAAGLLAAGCGGEAQPATVKRAPVTTPSPTCDPPRVHRSAYPGHGKGLEGIPWIEGEPRETGLVGLLAYWPPQWRKVRTARIYTGGRAPQGYNTKMLWVFLGPSAKRDADTELRVEGRRMDGPGTFHASFAGIGYEGQDGAPSYASIIDVPKPGCWRLTLTTGKLTATVDLRAVR
jgi:hypothetical protein